MPNLKDLKTRIESVKSTRKITKAMQLVSAAKLRHAQDRAIAGRSYAERMNRIMTDLVATLVDFNSAPKLLIGSDNDRVHLLVVATAERGLCGGFNASIVKLVRASIQNLYNSGKKIKILTIGKKGREQLKRDFGDYFIGHVDFSITKNLNYSHAHAIAMDIIQRFTAKEFDVAIIFYNRFQTVINQVPTAVQLIPAQFIAKVDNQKKFYNYEPDKDALLNELLPRALSAQIFTALLENGASEQGARMTAMDNATRNAGEMIDKLTIKFNRSRQAAITNELIEIISGAEAL